MKKIWLAAVGVVLLVGVIFLAGCGTMGGTYELKGNMNGQQEGIWVSGTGKVYAIPDIAEITLGIQTQAVSVAEAQTQATAAMNKVVAALKAAGIDDKDIQTQYYNINQVTKWDNNKNQSTIIAYSVTNTVVVKVRDVKNAGAVIDAVVVAGGDATRINGINFTVDDPTTYYAQAREKAVTYAKAKAEQMASLTGVKLGKVTYTTESTYMPYSNYMINRVEVAGAPVDTTSISAGQLEITTTVTLAYAIAD